MRVCVGLLRAQIQGLCALRFDTNLDIMALSTEVVKKRKEAPATEETPLAPSNGAAPELSRPEKRARVDAGPPQ